MAEFIGFVKTNCVGSKIEVRFTVDDEDLDNCKTEDEKEEIISDWCKEAIADSWEWGWKRA